jgi:hypothetical protein
MKLSKFDVIDDTYAALLATKTPAEKVAMVNNCFKTAKVLIAAGVRLRQPEWDEVEVQKEVCRVLLQATTVDDPGRVKAGSR